MFELKIAATRCSYAETDTAIALVVILSIFTDLLLGTQLINNETGLFHLTR